MHINNILYNEQLNRFTIITDLCVCKWIHLLKIIKPDTLRIYNGFYLSVRNVQISAFADVGVEMAVLLRVCSCLLVVLVNHDTHLSQQADLLLIQIICVYFRHPYTGLITESSTTPVKTESSQIHLTRITGTQESCTNMLYTMLTKIQYILLQYYSNKQQR